MPVVNLADLAAEAAAWREATAAAVFHSPLGLAALKKLTES